MAVLVSSGASNALNTSNGWRTVDASSVQMTTSGAALGVNTGTNSAGGSSFTPASGITIYGVVLNLGLNTAPGTGTVTISLREGATVRASVSVNGADLPYVAANGGSTSWVHFTFTTGYTTTGATYTINVANNLSTGTVALASNGVNMAKVITLSGLASLAADGTDQAIIAKELTGPGTDSGTKTIQVFLNASGTDQFGQLDVGHGGLLKFSTSPSIDYLLKMKGDLNVWAGGEFQMGHNLTPIPSNRKAELLFNCASEGQYGLNILSGGIFNACGATRTRWTKLGTSSANGATSSTLAVQPNGWKSGDSVMLVPTIRPNSYSANDFSTVTLSADVTSTSMSHSAISAASGHAISTNPPVDCEVANMTSNVRIYGASATLSSYIWVRAGTTLDMRHVEMFFLGGSGTNKYGVVPFGGGLIDSCAYHDMHVNASGLYIPATNNSNLVFNNNVVLGNCNAFNTQNTNTTVTVTNNLFGRYAGNLTIMGNITTTLTFNGNTLAGGQNAMSVSATVNQMGSFSNNTIHSFAGNGITLPSVNNGTFTNLKVYRCGATGINFSANTINGLTFDGGTFFGCANGVFTVSNTIRNMTFKNLTMYSDASAGYGQPSVFNVQTSSTLGLVKVIGGSLFASTAVISVTNPSNFYAPWEFHNVAFSASTFLSISAALLPNTADHAVAASINHNNVAGDHRLYLRNGEVKRDASIKRSGDASVRLTCGQSNATVGDRVEAPLATAPVNSGETPSVTVWVRKSVSGDGATYAGSQPRLIVKASPAIGINDDLVLATATNAANGAWQQLTGVLPAATQNGAFQIVVDGTVDGNSGFINADDLTVA